MQTDVGRMRGASCAVSGRTRRVECGAPCHEEPVSLEVLGVWCVVMVGIAALTPPYNGHTNEGCHDVADPNVYM